MKLPKNVKIMDSVVVIKEEKMETSIGFADYHNNKIIIDPDISESTKEEVFFMN